MRCGWSTRPIEPDDGGFDADRLPPIALDYVPASQSALRERPYLLNRVARRNPTAQLGLFVGLLMLPIALVFCSVNLKGWLARVHSPATPTPVSRSASTVAGTVRPALGSR
jgi:hypothetical protein